MQEGRIPNDLVEIMLNFVPTKEEVETMEKLQDQVWQKKCFCSPCLLFSLVASRLLEDFTSRWHADPHVCARRPIHVGHVPHSPLRAAPELPGLQAQGIDSGMLLDVLFLILPVSFANSFHHKVPFLRPVLTLCWQFSERLAFILPRVDSVLSASNQVFRSKALKRILEVVLALGGFHTQAFFQLCRFFDYG